MSWTRFYRAAMTVAAALVVTTWFLTGQSATAHHDDAIIASPDPFGQLRTFTTNGAYDLRNPSCQELGTNGRACFTCHRPDQGWTVTPRDLQRRFAESRGLDPVFRNNDGSNCEGADLSTLSKRRRAFSLLLARGPIRIGLTVPTNDQFT